MAEIAGLADSAADFIQINDVKLLAPIPRPGKVIATGTPEGVAMATGEFLQPGDKIQCKIENLGTLINTPGDPPTQFYKPLTGGIVS